MDVILDTNIFVHDFRMEKNHFQELFRYLRRTGSSLVIPNVVFREAVQKYQEKLYEWDKVLRTAWSSTQRAAISDIGIFTSPVDIGEEIFLFKKRLKEPAPKVKVLLHDDYSCVSVEEVVRRGVERVRPANADGEELRDVILWLMVLAYAKKKDDRVAFISDDGIFRGQDGSLNEELAADIAREEAEISYYRGISAFIADNSLDTQSLTEEQFSELVDGEAIKREAENSFRQVEMFWGKTQRVEFSAPHFVSAKRYRVAKDSFYVEAALTGRATITVARPYIPEFPYIQATNPFLENFPLTRVFYSQGQQGYSSVAYPQGPLQNPLFAYSQGWSNATYGGNVPLIYLAQLGVEQLYKCSVELDVSATLDGSKVTSLQVDDWKITEVEPAASPPAPEADSQRNE